MSLSHRKGDMFEIAEETDFKDFALAHCISEDCAMGKGVAVEFRKRFGGIPELKRQVAAGKKTGSVCVLQKDRPVYYLITKRTYRNKPTYESLQKSLEALRLAMAESKAPGIVMPKIGCGLDRLEWPKVEAMLKKTFAATDIKLVVCSL